MNLFSPAHLPSASKTERPRVDGLSWNVYQLGASNAPALVLIHGMFGDYRDWEPVLEPLALEHRVIAVDLLGFGDSDKPRMDYTPEFYVSQLHGLLQQLEIERVTLVGNSFGGIICLHYALQYPEQVEGLVLIASGGIRLWSPIDCELARERFSEANIRRFTPAYQQRLFAPLFVKGRSVISERYLAKQEAKLFRPDFPDFAYAAHSAIKMALASELFDELPRIQAPVLMLHGENDPIIPLRWMQEAAGKFPHARLQVLKDCGHVPQLECAPEVVAAISGFVRE